MRAYQAHLVGRRVSWGALNHTVCALRFYYGATLGRSDLPARIAYAPDLMGWTVSGPASKCHKRPPQVT
ncbi:hypothetical protein [Mesorhizobium ventifaucium]|uniref:Integrase n=1 Tax=Mesorhizobium ventifaucium TaxID=666020 RepID=A0ABM9EC11_9HYPH|nr:hypothetical protein [Mesorhizobium ventifaucium]CAH2406778.1 hypothetical protein MES4922_550019 [Mesorhizobium ventifaucium]